MRQTRGFPLPILGDSGGEACIESLNPRGAKSPRMAEDTDEEEPAVELGEGEPVEGAPIVRVAERLTWAIQKSEVDRKEGETVIRTPDGPRELSEILSEMDETYFVTRAAFLEAVRDVIGAGPIPVAEETEE